MCGAGPSWEGREGGRKGGWGGGSGRHGRCGCARRMGPAPAYPQVRTEVVGLRLLDQPCTRLVTCDGGAPLLRVELVHTGLPQLRSAPTCFTQGRHRYDGCRDASVRSVHVRRSAALNSPSRLHSLSPLSPAGGGVPPPSLPSLSRPFSPPPLSSPPNPPVSRAVGKRWNVQDAGPGRRRGEEGVV